MHRLIIHMEMKAPELCVHLVINYSLLLLLLLCCCHHRGIISICNCQSSRLCWVPGRLTNICTAWFGVSGVNFGRSIVPRPRTN